MGAVLLRYSINRLVQTVVVLMGVSIIVFLMLYTLPGNPAKLMAGMKASPETVTNIKHKLGLDRPLYVQYFRYMLNLAKGDLGTSYRYGRPVSEILGAAFPATAVLAFLAIVIEIVLGLAGGILAAVKRKTFIDSFITVGSTFLICVPVFWLGMLLQYFFGLKLGWLPVSGYVPLDLSYLILPAITLAAVSMALVLRLVRSSMLETAGAPFVTMARAKGLSESRVIVRHQLKNALMPVVTFIGLDLGALMTGAVATEIVFNYPGVGLAMYQAVLQRDLPVVVSGVLIMVFLYAVFNFIVDILYGFINPKIRFQDG